jgi:tetratricopeptide (TPR) repeat protein
VTAATPYPYTKHILVAFLLVLMLFIGLSRLLLRYGDSFIREMAAQSALVRGDEMLKERNYSSAVQEFRSFALLAPEDYRAVSRLSEALLLRGEVQEARAQAQRALALAEPNKQVEALTRLARAQMGTQEAVATVDRAWEAAADADKGYLALVRAQAYRRADRFQAASDMYRGVLAEDSKSGEAWYGLAKCSEGLQTFDDVLHQWAQVAAAIDGEHTPDYQRVISRYRDRAARYEAQAQASELSPEDYAAWGIALKENGRWDEAQVIFDRAHDADLAAPDTLYWLGVDAEIQGNTGEAASFYSQALALDPSHADARRATDRLGK